MRHPFPTPPGLLHYSPSIHLFFFYNNNSQLSHTPQRLLSLRQRRLPVVSTTWLALRWLDRGHRWHVPERSEPTVVGSTNRFRLRPTSFDCGPTVDNTGASESQHVSYITRHLLLATHSRPMLSVAAQGLRQEDGRHMRQQKENIDILETTLASCRGVWPCIRKPATIDLALTSCGLDPWSTPERYHRLSAAHPLPAPACRTSRNSPVL